jgi:hypothetical protein
MVFRVTFKNLLDKIDAMELAIFHSLKVLPFQIGNNAKLLNECEKPLF